MKAVILKHVCGKPSRCLGLGPALSSEVTLGAHYHTPEREKLAYATTSIAEMGLILLTVKDKGSSAPDKVVHEDRASNPKPVFREPVSREGSRAKGI